MSLAQDNESTPRRIGVYRLEEEIGAGAMGKVYRATHETLGKPVALKLVHADDPSGEVSARFLQEGIAASRIRHPNVVEILDAGTHKGTAFMAMQLLEGETLAECLSRQGRLPPTYAVDLILPVCSALVAAHEAGVLHRDMKPANIFLADVGRGDPEPILLDFGISKILGPVDPELTQNPRFLGSPLYIAPEQADGAPGSPRSDQYSLALSLYEALLGVRPFAKYSTSLIQLLRHVAEGDIRPPRELDPSIPDELDEAISRALSTDPRERFASVREFGAALLPFASQGRRLLWQQSFVNAERTMASANAPISESNHSSRRVQVSVDARPATAGGDDFVSHSSLFGSERSPGETEAERSSISRRDPYSQAPSDRPSGGWSEEQRGTHPSLQRATFNPSEPGVGPEGPGPSRRTLIVAVGVVAFVVALVIALRPWAPADTRVFTMTLAVSPPQATIEIDGQRVGTGKFIGKFRKDGSVHRARISLAGHEPQTLVFRDQAPPERIVLNPLPATRAKEAGPTIEKQPMPEPPAAGEEEPSKPETARAAGPKQAGPSPQPSADAPQSHPSSGHDKPPSDPELKEVSKEPKADTAAPPHSTAHSPEETTPSIQTGNLDPWAQ